MLINDRCKRLAKYAIISTDGENHTIKGYQNCPEAQKEINSLQSMIDIGITNQNYINECVIKHAVEASKH